MWTELATFPLPYCCTEYSLPNDFPTRDIMLPVRQRPSLPGGMDLDGILFVVWHSRQTIWHYARDNPQPQRGVMVEAIDRDR